MRTFLIGFLIVGTFQLAAQSKESLVGLWLISEVRVGEQMMTPDARWSRFNADGTQESGNGWFQHAYGTYEFDEGSMELSVETKNQLDDPFGPFNVSFEGSNEMSWIRREEGEQVQVSLVRIDELPSTNRDKLIGLWQLKEAEGAGPFYEEDGNESDYLFIRWDGKFVIGKSGNRIYGVYNVHAHKPEIELIPYGDSNRSFWKFDLQQSEIEISLLNSEHTVKRRFERIRSFPK